MGSEKEEKNGNKKIRNALEALSTKFIQKKNRSVQKLYF